MATLQELQDAFIAADEAGDEESAAAFAAEIDRMQAQPAVPEQPIMPVPGVGPQVPSAPDPLLYPNVPGQRIPSTGAFNPEMAIQSLVDITRGGANAIIPFGGMDRIRAGITGTEPTEEFAASEAARSRLDPGVALGTELGIGAMVPLEAGIALASQAAKSIPAVKSIMNKPPKMIEDTITSIRQRAATEHIPKAQIVRQETKKIFDELGPAMAQREKDALNEIIQSQGGPVRKLIEKTASKKPTLGLGPSSLTVLGGGGTYAGGALGQADLGAKLLGARVAGGLLAKGVVGGAKKASNITAEKQIKKLADIFTTRHVPTTLPPPKFGVEPPAPKTAPVSKSRPESKLPPSMQPEPPKSVLSTKQERIKPRGPKPEPRPVTAPNSALENARIEELYRLADQYKTKPDVRQAGASKPKSVLEPTPPKSKKELSKELTEVTKEFRAKPKSIIAKDIPEPKVTPKKDKPVAKKAAARAERKAEVSAVSAEEKERRAQIMRDIMAKKRKRGVGSY